MAVIKLKDDAGNWVPINNLIKPAPTPTLINTRTYSVPATGGEFWIDTVAAGGTVSLPLPLAPANNTLVSVQIVDNGTSDLFLTPTAPDTIGFQAVGLSGKYAGASRNLGETLKYVNGRWLPYYGRLVYQAAIAAIVLPPETVFFALFEGANNSTTFTDLRANPISVRSGTPVISTAQSLFGNGSLYLDGLSSLVVPAAASLVSGTQEFRWDIALYPTAFTPGDAQGIFDHRSANSANPESFGLLNQVGLGTINHFNGINQTGVARLKLNQWQVISIERYQGIKTIYLDDVPIYSGVDTVNYIYTGNLTIGDIVDTAFPYGSMFIGYIQYVRKTIGSSRKQGYGTDARTFTRPPLTDTDPLDAFKIVDINCDTGVILDTKGHVITPTGAVAVSGVQKRAGSHSIALTGGHLDIAGGSDFNFGSAPYSIHSSVRLNNVGTANAGANTYPNNQYFCDFDSADTSSLNYLTYLRQPGFRITNAGSTAVNLVETPGTNTWYELALTKIDTKYLLIRNNVIAAASNNAPATANLTTMRLGNSINGSYPMQGYMDSISVYKGIANGANLTHSYPLRFLARFSGGSVNDELGAVGTIVGTVPTYDTVNKRSLEASALFPGTGHITYPQIPAYDLGGGGFEIAGWAKGSATQVIYPGLVSIGETTTLIDAQTISVLASVTGFTGLSGKLATNKLALFVGAVSTSQPTLVSTTSFNDNQPHYWRIIKYVIGASACTVMVVDGKIEDVYIGAYTIAPTTRPLLVGSDGYDPGNRRFNGNQDDIAIYRA